MKTQPERTIAELKELRQLTADENGAQRVAFTETWARARAWLRKKLEEFGPEIHTDEAGNLWATLRGESDKALLIGGHIDSVPNGGWLDGCLDTLAGLERHAIPFHGQAAHSGSTPMNRRKDAFLAAAKMVPEIYRIAELSKNAVAAGVSPAEGGTARTGVCTIGSCTTKPGIATSIVEECRVTLDQRHLDAPALARMYAEARDASERFAKEG